MNARMLSQRTSHRLQSDRDEDELLDMSEPGGEHDDDEDSLLQSSDSLSPRFGPEPIVAAPFISSITLTQRRRICLLVCVMFLAIGLLLPLVVLAVRPLTLLFDRHVSLSCRGVSTNRFSLSHSSYRAPEHCPAYRSNASSSNTSLVHIHFVYGMEADTVATNFTFLTYLAMLSAWYYHRPNAVVHVHHHYPLTGEWFLLLQTVLGSALELHEVADVTSIFGRPVSHYAHKADIVRLEALRKYGGVYLDADVITIRPLHPLLAYSTVLAEEPIGPGLLNYATTLFVDGYGSTAERMRGVDGLANAVIFAHADAPFINSWYERYHSFDSSDWDYHSCKLPILMASEPPSDSHSVAANLLTLSIYAFYHPQYDTLIHFFHSDDVDLTHNYGIHFAHLHRRLGQHDYQHFVGGVSSVEEGLERNKHNNLGRVLRGLLYNEVTW